MTQQTHHHHHHHHRAKRSSGRDGKKYTRKSIIESSSSSCDQQVVRGGGGNDDKDKQTATVMKRTLNRLKGRRLSFVSKFNSESGNGKTGKQQQASNNSSSSSSSSNNNNNNNNNNNITSELEYSESQNSVRTCDLFKYARKRELFAVCCGITFMIYAASWQPISVFILAIMASLMGQYSKQTNWLRQLNSTSSGGSGGGGGASGSLNHLVAAGPNIVNIDQLIDDDNDNDDAHVQAPNDNVVMINDNIMARPNDSAANLVTRDLFSYLTSSGSSSSDDLHQDHYHHHHHLTSSSSSSSSSSSLNHGANIASSASNGVESADYEKFSFLHSLYSFVTPLFDLSSSVAQKQVEEEHIKAAVHDILEHESRQFLRKSFEINASAFVLALTQLLAFFLGMSLITWAAKKQASRIKLLYFNSCLHQEVTWFEAIDSASGSGSSLNGLVDKYQDGIGMKLALLSYFLGHVGLFALTAFYQMFSLAAFCMPFVLAIGLIIGYLSDRQASSIGYHALFAKRSLQLAEEIIAAIRTVFAFNGQQKEITRYSLSLEPVYGKSLVKHLYTALNTSLSKFSIFACFAIYCFYAKHLFPPHSNHANSSNKSTILAVMRGAEVSIVNILISIPFLEALQQSKGSIARIFVAIERRSKISAASTRGLKLSSAGADLNGHAAEKVGPLHEPGLHNAKANNGTSDHCHSDGSKQLWRPSISFRMVLFDYADRSGPTRRRSTLPFLNLANSMSDYGGGVGGANKSAYANSDQLDSTATTNHSVTIAVSSGGGRRRSVIEKIADETIAASRSSMDTSSSSGAQQTPQHERRRQSSMIRNMLNNEVRERRTGEHRQILHYFNLDIEPGQSIALVGPSGSGKSTVLALVQRLYDVTGGQLLVGGRDVKELNVGWLRDQIGLVGQEPRLFDMSIAENIMLGLSSDEFELLTSGGSSLDAAEASRQLMQQVVEAARAANAHEFIARLPGGYATRVGSGGVQLSGGQKQRIAIARALIRKPKILLLDECTSALDTESESQVHVALKRASSGRTTLIVAHRLETIKHVDMIVVMSQGQVVACGKHAELMEAAHDSSSDIYHGARIYKQLYDEQSSVKSSPLPVTTIDEKPELVEAQKSNGDLAVLAGFRDAGQAVDEVLGEDEDDDEYDDDLESLSSASSQLLRARPSFLALWQFIEMPKWSALAAVLICLLAGLILPLNLIAHSYLFSVFAYNELEQIGDYLHVFGLLILSFSTFVFIVSFLQVLLPGYVGEKMSIRLRVKTMESLLQKPMFYFDMDSNSAGAICDRFNGYISNLQNLAGTRVATMLEALSTLMVGAFFGFGKSFTLSMFCLSFALLVLITTIIESRIIERESSLQSRYDAQLAHLMADALSNIKTIAALHKESYFIRKFSVILKQREHGIGFGWLAVHTFLTSLKFVMPAMSWSASMYYGSYLLANERIDLQTIYIVCPVVLFAVNDTFRALVFLPELLKARKSIERLYKLNREFSPQVLQTLTLGQQLEQQNRLHLQQLVADTLTTSGSAAGNQLGGDIAQTGSDLLAQARKSIVSFALEAPTIEINGIGGGAGGDKENEIEQPEVAQNRRLSTLQMLPSYMRRKSSRLNSIVPSSQARGRIEFKQLEFAYPNRPTALVLDQFSLCIAPGESVALVGTSGSGKSTTVAILEKFYDYHGGSVTLDGRDLRLVEANWVRSQIGLVQQEPCLLSYTIGDNIRYGDNGRFVSMDEVVEAARTANIHDFIMSLPDQYDTELSSSAYSSCQLSGGQRQRIAIARALIRNAPILIFDEATSALDNKSEQVVQDALNKAKRGRTNLTIAHRLSTVKEADKIVVMRDGRVVEMGKHEELCKRLNGFYRSLWERQGVEGAEVSGFV